MKADDIVKQRANVYNTWHLLNKGFTLIELLAVIVILAIIAVIATPIVLNIISDAKISAADRSRENYINAVELAFTNYMLEEGKTPTGTYIIDNPKVLTNGIYIIKIDYNGSGITGGAVVVTNTGVINFKNITTNGTKTVYNKMNSKELKVTEDDGLYKSDNGRYIYRGENPNNYIWLDENGDGINPTDKSELYRIISYESDGTIKVIRNERISNPNPHKDESSTSFSWDTRDTTYVNNVSGLTGTRQNTANSYCNYGSNSDGYYGCNAWGKQTNTYFQSNLLGTSFYYKYYANNTTTTLSQNATNLAVENNATLNNYLNNDWLNANSNLNNYIEEYSFNVGGPMYYSTYTGGVQGIEKEKYQEDLSTWKGKVGLMNITEYTDASLDNACTSVYNSFYYNPKYYYDKNNDGTKTQNIENNNWPCKTKNYLYKSNYSQWSLSVISYSHYNAWSVSTTGYLIYNATYGGLAVRPAFYLKSTIDISGEGTETNPYIVIE